jgi:hypothetical protein
MKLKAIIVAAFFGGFLVSSALQFSSLRLIPEARADVAGMGTYQLENDPAFRQAVKNVVEQSCRTDLKFWNNGANFRTWHYCNPGSQYAP